MKKKWTSPFDRTRRPRSLGEFSALSSKILWKVLPVSRFINSDCLPDDLPGLDDVGVTKWLLTVKTDPPWEVQTQRNAMVSFSLFRVFQEKTRCEGDITRS